jgi:hypothetical protein
MGLPVQLYAFVGTGGLGTFLEVLRTIPERAGERMASITRSGRAFSSGLISIRLGIPSHPPEPAPCPCLPHFF